MIDLANELAGRSTVFLCNALPGVMDPLAIARIDERIVLLEGTLGILPWTWDGDPRVERDRDGSHVEPRAEVIRELIAFHEIKVVHSRGEWADRLVIATGLAAADPLVQGRRQRGPPRGHLGAGAVRRGPHFDAASGRPRLQGPSRDASHDREVSVDRAS